MAEADDYNKGEQRTERDVKKRTAIAFTVFIACFCIGGIVFAWLYNQPQDAGGTQPALRKGFEMNERVFSLFYSRHRDAKHFEKSDAVRKVRVNGDVGMDGQLDTATWRMKVVRKPGDTLLLTLNDIMALPKAEVVFDFKCIEGWSQVTWWGGVRFADFLRAYKLAPQMAAKYVGLVTPDREYYVGIDMPSMLQPQTILCYEMNGKPLPQDQGYPLRLIIPVKYGIKHLKRIGVMYFSNDKPADYWAERGYDYYSGL